jgi:hypothetical protein
MRYYGVPAVPGGAMETFYDWVSLGIFAGLIVLFLQRSTSERVEKDASLLFYLAAGIGCAVANYFGDKGEHVVAIMLLAGTVAFILYYLKPFRRSPHS